MEGEKEGEMRGRTGNGGGWGDAEKKCERTVDEKQRESCLD